MLNVLFGRTAGGGLVTRPSKSQSLSIGICVRITPFGTRRHSISCLLNICKLLLLYNYFSTISIIFILKKAENINEFTYTYRYRFLTIVCILTVTVHGGWTSWSAWSGCTKSCREGARTRNRNCTNPLPSNGVQTCAGLNLTTEVCSTQNCPGS